MEIYLSRSFTEWGPFVLSEVKDLLRRGIIRSDDYARREDTPDWYPVETLVADLEREPAGVSELAYMASMGLSPTELTTKADVVGVIHDRANRHAVEFSRHVLLQAGGLDPDKLVKVTDSMINEVLANCPKVKAGWHFLDVKTFLGDFKVKHSSLWKPAKVARKKKAVPRVTKKKVPAKKTRSTGKKS